MDPNDSDMIFNSRQVFSSCSQLLITVSLSRYFLYLPLSVISNIYGGRSGTRISPPSTPYPPSTSVFPYQCHSTPVPCLHFTHTNAILASLLTVSLNKTLLIYVRDMTPAIILRSVTAEVKCSPYNRPRRPRGEVEV
jgi:hypothetical protein